MAQLNPLFLDTGSIRQTTSSLNAVIDYGYFPLSQSGLYFTTLLPDPYLFASQSVRVSNAVNTTSSSLYSFTLPARSEKYFYTSDAIIGVSSSVTTTGVRIGLRSSVPSSSAFNVRSPSTLTAFTFACVGSEDNTIFVLPAGHAAINTVYPTHIKGLLANASPTSPHTHTFLVQPETNNVVSATTGSIFFNQYAGGYINELDTSFNASGSITTLFNNDQLEGACTAVTQSDGKVILGVTIGANNVIARLNTDGTLDGTFSNPTLIFTSQTPYVRCVDIQSDGKVIVGGYWQTIDAVNQWGIARLNTDGTLDNTFDVGTGISGSPNIQGTGIHDVKVLSDGKIMIAGGFTTFSGSAVNDIIRLNSNGTIDTSFNSGTGFNANAYKMAFQSDDKIIVGGFFNNYSGSARNGIVRLNTDGTLDTTFNTGTGPGLKVYDVKVLPDEKILAVGPFTSYSGSTSGRIVRINPDGSKDNTFNPGGIGFESGSTAFPSGMVSTISLLPNNQILVGGNYTRYNGVLTFNFTRLTYDGKLDGLVGSGSGVVLTTSNAYGINVILPLSNNQAYIGGYDMSSFNGITSSILGSPIDGDFIRVNPISYGQSFQSPLYLLSGSLRPISGSDTVTSSFLPPTSSLWLSQSLATNVANTSNTVYANVFTLTGLTTNQRYLANLYIIGQSAAAATGFRMRVITGSEYMGTLWTPTSTTAPAIQNSANANNITSTTAGTWPTLNTKYLVYGEYTFVKGATDPQVQILSETNGTAVTAFSGSVIFYRPIS